jgi:uncharacterized protein (DUF1778 family)
MSTLTIPVAPLAFVRLNAVHLLTFQSGKDQMSLTKTRQERLEARITADQKELFKEAAELRGQSLTDFVVTSVRDAAMAVLRERHLFELTRRDREAFVAAVLRSPRPQARLRRAAQRHGYLRKR